MACVFAVMVQFLLRFGAIAVQALVGPVLSPGAEIWSKPLVQLRGTRLLSSK